ncbi:uncharacterized protein LTR77_010883 [Saxophila tyrrhenica]|uniref:Beta-galactosidase n=1 Tax=Saxophila tyrrhenica TaxID=1690608 RepID=A0AAV9NVP5_9PEZI|nr:hypothetical protein LTR77_010883 [Saxophila tyrrhenica]
MHFLRFLSSALLAGSAAGMSIPGTQGLKVKPYKREVLQDIVTWDQHSIFVHGERVLFYSGEYHPFRLPVPGLWLDVFQKIRAMGYTGVSIYTDWALHEGKPGDWNGEGIFDLQPFFDAAKQAGIYILARPGPYINAEVSGGGFPGWLQRVPGTLRSDDQAYLDATDNYVKNIGAIIGKNQITNGGPVILFQPENEYYSCTDDIDPCPNPDYMQYVEDQFRNASIVVPYIVNDNNEGNFAPGQPAAVDIYGIDSYPLGFDCANPETWPEGALQTYLTETHLNYSALTPFSFIEFQGGSFDPWGGWGFQQCLELVSYEFERVFYQNNFASAITIFSIYMTYGGTNWGNLGHPGGYTSYDYAAVIKENRMVDREKYSEAKLLANFVQASPAYITSTPGNLTNTTYTTSSDLSVTPLFGNGSDTNFYVLRHSNYSGRSVTPYKLTIPTSKGKLTVPQLGGELSLHGRDSKVHVSDYKVGGHNVLYSSAEVFTWESYGHDSTVLVVYGGDDERHEMAVSKGGKATIREGVGVKTGKKNDATVLNWETSSSRRVVQLGCGLTVYILDRNSAYNYWVLKVPNDDGLYGPNLGGTTVIAQAGYLMRNATVSGNTLSLVGDFNATTDIEVIGGAPSKLVGLNINGKSTKFSQDKYGVATASVSFNPDISVPSLSSLDWKYIDSLPEIKPGYDDSQWPAADLKHTHNDLVVQRTPTSLLGSDYGFNTGTLLFRGHFTANGDEKKFSIETQGGSAFGSSTWIDDTFLGSWHGYDAAANGNNTFTMPNLKSGSKHVITVVVDQQGMDENYDAGADEMKNPRGILHYHLSGHKAADVSWKLTGNLGGEDYLDRSRGPLNEGGLWAERQGYHLPGAPIDDWHSSGGPTEGIDGAGIAFYAAELDLDIPSGWDVPLSFTFTNSSASNAGGNQAPAYHVQLYVNGFQFGKYINNVGPQKSFPVPEGIFNYHGTNYLAFALWSLEAEGAKVGGLELSVNGTVLSGYGDVPMSPMSSWSKRKGAY